MILYPLLTAKWFEFGSACSPVMLDLSACAAAAATISLPLSPFSDEPRSHFAAAELRITRSVSGMGMALQGGPSGLQQSFVDKISSLHTHRGLALPLLPASNPD